MCQQGAYFSHLQFPSVQGDRLGLTAIKWSYATSHCEKNLYVSTHTAEMYNCEQQAGLTDSTSPSSEVRGVGEKTALCASAT